MSRAGDLPDSESPDRPRPAGRAEESPGSDPTYLISGTNGEDAGDDLLEYGAVTFFREREHRGHG